MSKKFYRGYLLLISKECVYLIDTEFNMVIKKTRTVAEAEQLVEGILAD